MLLGIGYGVVGALQTGISWDETYHVMRLDNFLQHGYFALDWSVSNDQISSGGTNTLVYGPVTMLLLHALGVVTGVEGWDTVATTPAAYDVRHLGILLIGLLGTAAAAAITRILLGSWRWALFTAAALLALPMWTGHLMFNIKDVPVATGYTLVTLALVAMVGSSGRAWQRVLCLTGGVLLMVGTRPGMSAAVAGGLVVLTVGWFVTRRTRSGPLLKSGVLQVGVGLLAAFVVLLAVYPNLFAHPTKMLSSAEQSTSFRDGANASYFYIPVHVLSEVPLLLLALFGLGLVTAVHQILTRWRTDTAQVTRLCLVGLQLAALPVFAILKHSDVYNGLRQMLFSSPAWAVLVTVGLARAWTWARATGGSAVRVRLVAGTAAVALLAPMADQATQFPYQYTYYNAAADLVGARTVSDYWRVSVPELLPDIPTDGQIICSPTRATADGALAGTAAAKGKGREMIAGRYTVDSSVDCRTNEIGPLASPWLATGRSLASDLPNDTFYALIDRGHRLPLNCTQLAEVNRTRHFRTIQMTMVVRCTAEPTVLASEPVTFDRPSLDAPLPVAAWAYLPRGWVARASSAAVDSSGASATVTFDTASACGSGCALALDADVPDDAVAVVNNVPAALDRDASSGALTVTLPPGTTSAWVTFRRTSDKPLDLRIRSMRLAPPHQP